MSNTYKEGQPDEIRSITPINLNDKVQEWINTLNKLIKINNVVMTNVEHSTDDIPFYKFGFMSANDKNYLDFLHSKMPYDSTSQVTLSVYADLIDTSGLVVSKVNKKVKVYTNSVVPINHDTDDVIIINGSGEITLDMAAGSGTDIGGANMYSEKIVYINALSNVIVKYTGTEGTWRFVNNGIVPNIKSTIGTEVINNETTVPIRIFTNNTLITEGNTLVLKLMIINSTTLISVIDNTQLVENYNNDEYGE